MKLSSVEIMADYRARLKQLRDAREACLSSANSLVVRTWRHGGEIDFAALLSKSAVRASLATMLDHEIGETVRSIEAHGVEVDE